MRGFLEFWWHALRDAGKAGWAVIGIIDLGLSWFLAPAIHSIPALASHPAIANFEISLRWRLVIFFVPVICYIFWAPYRYNREIERKHAEKEAELKTEHAEREAESQKRHAEREAELLNQISEDRKRRLAQRNAVARACADYLIGKRSPNILHALTTAKADELEFNDDLLFIAEKLMDKGREDWLWNEVQEYIPKEKMLLFLQMLRDGSVNTQDPWESADFLRKSLPGLYAPGEPPLPLPPPTG